MSDAWVTYRIRELCEKGDPVYNKKEWAISKLQGGVQVVTNFTQQNDDQNIKCILITDWIIEVSGAAGIGQTTIKDLAIGKDIFKFIQVVDNQNIVMNQCFHLVESDVFGFTATNDKVIAITIGYHRISQKT